MPLNATTLAGAIADAVDAANLPNPAPTVADGDGNRRLTRAARVAAMQPVAQAIIDHLENHAVITGTCPTNGGPLIRGRIT